MQKRRRLDTPVPSESAGERCYYWPGRARWRRRHIRTRHGRRSRFPGTPSQAGHRSVVGMEGCGMRDDFGGDSRGLPLGNRWEFDGVGWVFGWLSKSEVACGDICRWFGEVLSSLVCITRNGKFCKLFSDLKPLYGKF